MTGMEAVFSGVVAGVDSPLGEGISAGEERARRRGEPTSNAREEGGQAGDAGLGERREGIHLRAAGAGGAGAVQPDPMTALHLPRTYEERPANEVRSVGRYFCSEAEDKAWYYDKDLWRGYLDVLVASRFNRFCLGVRS